MCVLLIGLSAPNVAIPHFTAVGEMRSNRLYRLNPGIRCGAYERRVRRVAGPVSRHFLGDCADNLVSPTNDWTTRVL